MADARALDVVLFDLGGVLMEFTGPPVIARWMADDARNDVPSTDDVWVRWLESPSVRLFETGGSTPEEFASSAVEEFRLAARPEEFLAAFVEWPRGFSARALDLVAGVRRTHRVACLSNSNAIHWSRFRRDHDIESLFDGTFASHLIGAVKPDRAVFDHVISRLDCAPERVLFIDDNQLCVDGARAAGLVAARARGLDETMAVLSAHGLVVDSGGMNAARILAKYESTDRAWRARLEPLDQDGFARVPDDGGWSVGQICWHVSAVSEMLLGNAEKAAAGDGEDRGFSFLPWMLTAVGSLPPMRIKVPPLPPELEHMGRPEATEKADALARLDAMRERMRSLVTAVDGASKRVRREHPAGGWLHAQQWYRMNEMHLRHHLRQVGRLLD